MGSKELLVLFLFTIIIFFPTYIGGMSLALGQKVLYVFYPAILACLFLFFKNRSIYLPKIAIIIFSAFCFYVFSILSKFDFINVQILLGHFRYLAYFFIFLFTYNIAINLGIGLKELYLPILYLGVLTMIFVLLQLLIPDLILKLGITNREAIGRLGFRIGGPLVWSYSYGFVLLPIIFLIFSKMFKGAANKWHWLFFIVLLLTILAGQSKAAYLAYIINFIFFCYLGFRYGKSKTMLSIVILLFLFIAMLVTYVIANLDDFGNIERFVSSVTSNGEDASTQTRLNQLSYISLTLENNPFLGYPAEYVVIENGYGYYLYNYGLFGLFYYLLLLIYFFCKSLSTIKIVHNLDASEEGRSVSLAYFSIVLGAVIFSLANSPLDGHKVAYFFWTLSGLYFGALRVDLSEFKNFED